MVLACCATWLSGLVFGAIPVFFHWVSYDTAEMICAIQWDQDFQRVVVCTLTAFVCCFLVPIAIILTSYSLMLRTFQESSRKFNKASRSGNASTKLAEMIIALVVVYLVCYTPFALTKVLKVARRSMNAVPAWLSTVASIMAFLNCGLNPLIYSTNKEFQEAVLALCHCKLRKLNNRASTGPG
nr:PREDICTED: pinopsin-like [Latimeria chalumnae]|eukprot:XP_005999320.1 PREDICTED: pinopsin-like [Latimeria chalumnae]